MTGHDHTRYDLRITLPDPPGGEHPDRFLGPFDNAADALGLAATWQQPGTRRVPAGVHYAIVEHDPRREHRNPRPPADPTQLAMLIPNLPTGQTFPDTLDVLCAVYGPGRGAAVWTQACDLVETWTEHTIECEQKWTGPFAPVGHAADITRAHALHAAEDDRGGAEHRMWASLTGILDQTIAHRDELPVPMLAWVIKLAEAVVDTQAQIRAELALADAIGDPTCSPS